MEFNKEDKIKRARTAILHESAGGFLFFQEPRSRRLFVALLKTSSGEYVIPKGHLKKGEAPEDAALREIKEELLLDENPRMVGKIGISRYTFALAEDKLPHRKKVYLYVFCSEDKEKISSLKSEGLVAAKWLPYQDALKKITFSKKDLVKAKKIFSLNYSLANQSQLDTAIADALRASRKTLASNLFAVILSGSVARGTYRDGWSDIDILLVVEKLGIDVKRQITAMIEQLEKKTNIHHGVNVVAAREIITPSNPTVALDGKTLQALLELRQHPDRLLYVRKGHSVRFYVPTKREMKEYSLANIGMFARKNRRDLTVDGVFRRERLKGMLKTEIRASLTMVKLAIQYFGEYSERTSILDQARKTFPLYNFQFLKTAKQIVQRWGTFNKEKDVVAAVAEADRFIEEFSQYVYKKTRSSRRR